jgi:hypothetical protein
VSKFSGKIFKTKDYLDLLKDSNSKIDLH